MMLKPSTIPFVKSVNSKPVLVNPLAETGQITAYLDQVRTQLQQVAVDQDLPDAFTAEDTLSADLRKTELGQQYTTLQQQVAWLEQAKSYLMNAGRVSGTVLLLGSAGAMVMYVHQQGWLKQVRQRLGQLPRYFRRSTTTMTSVAPATDLAVFVRDLVAVGALAVKVILTTEAEATYTGPLTLNPNKQFVLSHLEGNLIFEAEAIQAVATVLNHNQAPETVITINAGEQFALDQVTV
ncbi:MAG: hypothetical protein AAF629_00260 [Chloroflexota bacterium]